MCTHTSSSLWDVLCIIGMMYIRNGSSASSRRSSRRCTSRETTTLGRSYLFILTHFESSAHDVCSLGPHDSPSPLARTRYNQTFGVVPSQVRFGNHTFLLVDAPLLADEEISPGVGSSSALARAKELSRGGSSVSTSV
jgi:hypothetical protein